MNVEQLRALLSEASRRQIDLEAQLRDMELERLNARVAASLAVGSLVTLRGGLSTIARYLEELIDAVESRESINRLDDDYWRLTSSITRSFAGAECLVAHLNEVSAEIERWVSEIDLRGTQQPVEEPDRSKVMESRLRFITVNERPVTTKPGGVRVTVNDGWGVCSIRLCESSSPSDSSVDGYEQLSAACAAAGGEDPTSSSAGVCARCESAEPSWGSTLEGAVSSGADADSGDAFSPASAEEEHSFKEEGK